MITDNQVTWVILAGGQGSRMGGQDKGLISFQGKPLIHHIMDALSPQATCIRICANRNLDIYRAYAPVIQDIITGYAGPLAGLHAALSTSCTEWTGILPCDGPFIDSHFTKRFYQASQSPAQVYVADDGSKLQPVYALVHQSLLPKLEIFLNQGGRKVALFYQQADMIRVDCQDICSMFVNMNTPDQLSCSRNEAKDY